MRALGMHDAPSKVGALAAVGGTLATWVQSSDVGLLTTFIVAITGAFVWAYKQVEAARRENRAAWIKEIRRAEVDAQVEAMERLRVVEDQAHANTAGLGSLKGELKQKGVIDDGSGDDSAGVAGEAD